MNSQKNSKTISIRQSLLRNMVVLVLVLSGAILAATAIASRNASKEISHMVIDNASRRTDMELDRFFNTIREQVLIARCWAADQMLDADDVEALNSIFVPILEKTLESNAP